jgi:hypothetical protein
MWWWRIGIAAASVVVIAVIVVGKGMWLIISLPAIAATGTNLWSARDSVRQCAAPSLPGGDGLTARLDPLCAHESNAHAFLNPGMLEFGEGGATPFMDRDISAGLGGLIRSERKPESDHDQQRQNG